VFLIDELLAARDHTAEEWKILRDNETPGSLTWTLLDAQYNLRRAIDGRWGAGIRVWSYIIAQLKQIEARRGA